MERKKKYKRVYYIEFETLKKGKFKLYQFENIEKYRFFQGFLSLEFFNGKKRMFKLNDIHSIRIY